MICNNKLLFQVGKSGGGGCLIFANVAQCYPAFPILGNIGTCKNWQKLKYLHKLLQIILLFSI